MTRNDFMLSKAGRDYKRRSSQVKTTKLQMRHILLMFIILMVGLLIASTTCMFEKAMKSNAKASCLLLICGLYNVL